MPAKSGYAIVPRCNLRRLETPLTRKKSQRPRDFANPAPREAAGKPAPHRAAQNSAVKRPAPEARTPKRDFEHRGRREPRASDVVQIYGFHSVSAALKAPRRKLIRLYATQAAAERLSDEIAARGIETQILDNEEISRRAPREAVHQGVLLEARPLEPIDIADLPERGLVIVLDQVTDPHNVGAILRTGAAFGVDALVTTERHSPEFTGALAKSASGGLEHVPICSVVNLSRALSELGDLGYLRIGLDSDGPVAIGDATVSHPLALVLGAEGKGLRRLTREHCDILARLDMPGAIKSLNVSNACAVALALVSQKLKAAP
jgi:23S rRNA (guanosine2251-2'-O)-methyltransferase